MPRPDQAARPCLLTRFPYGVMPDEATLKLTAAAEDWLEAQPECAHLRFRLRFPDPTRPYHAELHVEEKASKGFQKQRWTRWLSASKPVLLRTLTISRCG